MNAVVLIPALNEELAIGDVVRGIPRGLVDLIVVVDNGSDDGTAAVAAGAGATVVSEPRRGYGAACMAGVRSAPDAAVYIFLDGDGSDPPEMIPSLLAVHRASGLTLGVRRGAVEPGSMPWRQRAGNAFMTRLIGRLSGRRITDLPSYKVIDGALLRSFSVRSSTHGWTPELILTAAMRGVPIAEVATGYRRRKGKSKVSGSIKGSVLAAIRMNHAILRTWWMERRRTLL